MFVAQDSASLAVPDQDSGTIPEQVTPVGHMVQGSFWPVMQAFFNLRQQDLLYVYSGPGLLPTQACVAERMSLRWGLGRKKSSQCWHSSKDRPAGRSPFTTVEAVCSFICSSLLITSSLCIGSPSGVLNESSYSTHCKA